MEEDKYLFESLRPIDNADLGVYENALNYVFDNSNIKNIAISGAYCSGKSSILSSYEKKNNNLRFIHISLAHFKSPHHDVNGKSVVETVPNGESVLERKILNQLIHQIDPKKIPQTNFKVKKKISVKDVLKNAIMAVSFLILLVYLIFFDKWEYFVNVLPESLLKQILLLSTNRYALLVGGILIIAMLIYSAICFLKIQKERNILRKLNVQGNEIEIFEDCDDSYFDKYLNEVLYLFENSNTNVIVFEDIDRFDTIEIFERLHEINTLVNIKLQNTENEPLRFFYLLRDDIFVSKDRTKFFDFIIPIVPVIDSSNAYEQFISHFKNSGVYESFDNDFLRGLSLYIDDMRILKNIYNEFLIYYNKLNIIELDCNKMLAIIAYKNLFPRDFSNLQLNRGFLFTIFNNKEKFIELEIININKEIKDNEDRLATLQKESLESLRELNELYMYKDERLRQYDASNYKNVDELSNFVEERLDEKYKTIYLTRKSILKDKQESNLNKFNENINNLNKKIIEIKNKPICQIITRDNISEVFSINSENEIGEINNFNEIKGNDYFDLLKFLIINGYIDESYADYMTYFYEKSLSRTDKTFLRSVNDKKAKDVTYKITNPQLVISYLKLMDFSQEEILNFDLLEYLLKHSDTYKLYLDEFIKQLKDTENFEFINLFFENFGMLPNFIKQLNKVWTEAFQTALVGHLLDESQLHQYSILSLYNSDDTIIELMNKDDCLCEYISNKKDYLNIENPNIERIIDCFSFLNVSFQCFDFEHINMDLFDAVYMNSLYKINIENLKLIQNKILNTNNEEDIYHKNYTILCAEPQSAITQYVNRNINEYFKVILDICESNICDDEDVVINVLNNSDLGLELKQLYIFSLHTVIAKLSDIDDKSLWSLLLENNVVIASLQNVMDYFNYNALDSHIIAFINRDNNNVYFSEMEVTDKEEEIKLLIDAVTRCNEIDNTKYKQILLSLHCVFDNFTFTDISDDKMNLLIDNNIIKMTSNNLQFIRTYYPNLTFNFIKNNIDEYVSIMNSTPLVPDELFEILSWDISYEGKVELLKYYTDGITIIEKDYPSDICLYILNNNFLNSDLPILFKTFENYDEPVQNKILEFGKNNINNILNNTDSISESLRDKFLESDVLNFNEKIDLLIAILPNITLIKLKSFLTTLNLDDYIKLFDSRSRPRFEINEFNEKMLRAFKENKLIDNYEAGSENDKYYKVTKLKYK